MLVLWPLSDAAQPDDNANAAGPSGRQRDGDREPQHKRRKTTYDEKDVIDLT